MKTLSLCISTILASVQLSLSQYNADWGKYLGDPVPGADFTKDEEVQQLVVDVKDAAMNDEYIYVIAKTYSRNDHESYCGSNRFYYGAQDISLAKYDKCGNLQWMKFIGTDDDSIKNECGDFAVCLALDKDPFTDSTYIYVSGYSYNNYDEIACPTCKKCDADNSIKAFSCIANSCIFQKTKKSTLDAYIAKYDEKGKLLKWTYFGGDGDDYIIGMEIFNHDVFITGTTSSQPDFIPSSVPKFDSTLSTNLDAFVASLDRNLCSVKFFSYLGDKFYERTHSVKCFKALGSPTQFYISGASEGEINDPTYHPLNSHHGGENDAFLSLWRLNKLTKVFEPQWLRYIGGKNDDRDREMIIDNKNNAIVTGLTRSNDFIKNLSWFYPVENFYDTSYGGVKDAFLAKFDASGNPMWGTYFGGNASDETRGLVRYSVSPGISHIAISGATQSLDLPVSPVHPPFQTQLNGGSNLISRDAFVTILTDPGSPSEKQLLEFSSYMGGNKSESDNLLVDYGPDVELGGNDEMYMTFYTRSNDIENGISSPGYHFNTSSGNDHDGFLARIFNSNTPGAFDCHENNFDWGIFKMGIYPGESNNLIQIFPNPSSGIINIMCPEVLTGEIEFLLYDPMGRMIFTKSEAATEASSSTFHLDLKDLSPGIYFLELKTKDKISSAKLILDR